MQKDLTKLSSNQMNQFQVMINWTQIIKLLPIKIKKTFECEICKGNLNVYIASVHERKKPFKCEFCNNTYSRKNSLNQHIASIQLKSVI